MLNKEAFLRRTAFRWRSQKAKTRGWNAAEAELAEFVYDEILTEIANYLRRSTSDAELSDSSGVY